MSFYETQNDFINNLTLMFYSLIKFFGEVSRIFKLHLKLFKVSHLAGFTHSVGILKRSLGALLPK